MAKQTTTFSQTQISERTQRAIEKIYANRFSILKAAMGHSTNGRYQNAVEEYLNFFSIVSAFFNCQESEISPRLFEKGRDLAEIFLISQVYWDLCKIYDKDPRFSDRLKKYLLKFVEFSKGFKFEYANYQLIFKYLKSGKCRNKRKFESALNALKTSGDFCYVATYCFGENHPVTNDLRVFKKHLLKMNWGKKFVFFYYKFSPKLLGFCRKYPYIGVPLKYLIFYPFIFLIYLFWDKKILRFL